MNPPAPPPIADEKRSHCAKCGGATHEDPESPGYFVHTGSDGSRDHAADLNHSPEQDDVLEEVIFEERAEKSLETKPLPDLSLTERALARYDAEEPRLSKLIDAAKTNAEVADLLTKLEQLEEAVGAAFGDDTSDRNNPETCRKVIRPGPAVPPPGSELSFVRRMVAKWKGA